MSSEICLGKPRIDEKGLYFEKKNMEGLKVVSTERVRPEELGFKKSFEQKIYVKKFVSSSESLDNQEIFFSMTLTYAIPQEERYRFLYLFQTRSGSVFKRDFTGSPCPCSQVDVNDPELVKRSREKKLPENSILENGIPVFQIDPTSRELRRECILRQE